MPVSRTATTVALVATLLLALAAPAGAATETTTRGTATTSSVPLQVTVDGVEATMGELALIATTDSDTDERAPWSSVGLTLGDLPTGTVGELQVSSDGTTTNPGQSFGRNTAVGSVGATAAKLLATADDAAGSATASVESLSTNATILSDLGLSATITEVVSRVDDTGATATHSLAVAEIGLGLDNVLGDVMADLPLADLLALADELGVVVPNLDGASDVVTATESLVAAVETAATLGTAVDTAVDDLLDTDAALSELEVLLELSAAELLASPDLPEECDGLTELLVTGCVEGLIEGQELLRIGAASALQEAVDDYLEAVTAAAEAALFLEGISESIEGLITDLRAVNLLALGDIDVTQQVRAIGGEEDASSASTTCQLTSLSVLGADAIELANCDASGEPLTSAVELVSTTLQNVLDTVGGVEVEGELVQLDLFGTAQDTVTSAGDTVTATSVLEVLSLTIPSITINPCDIDAVELACALGLQDGLDLSGAITEVDEVLSNTQTDVLTALDLIDDELVTTLELDLDVSAAEAVQTTVDAALTSLLALLDGLDDAEGVAVPGVRVEIDPELVAQHTVTTASVDDPTPADPAPDPSDDPLPNTGGGAALLAVLAIGAGAWLWRARRRED